MRGADVAAVFLASFLHEQVLPALDGCDIGVKCPVLSEKLVFVLLAVDGLDKAGDNALRKSVYAVGGVMGVFKPSSCLIKSAHPGRGLRGSSEGRIGPVEVGVWRRGRTGLTVGDADGMTATEERTTRAKDCDVK